MDSFYSNWANMDWTKTKLTDAERDQAIKQYYSLASCNRRIYTLTKWLELYLKRMQEETLVTRSFINQYLNGSTNNINIKRNDNNHHDTTDRSNNTSNSINSDYSDDYNSNQNKTTESNNNDIDMNLNFNRFSGSQGNLPCEQSLASINSNNNNNPDDSDFKSAGSLSSYLEGLLKFDQSSSNQSITDIHTQTEDEDYFIDPPEFEESTESQETTVASATTTTTATIGNQSFESSSYNDDLPIELNRSVLNQTYIQFQNHEDSSVVSSYCSEIQTSSQTQEKNLHTNNYDNFNNSKKYITVCT